MKAGAVVAVLIPDDGTGWAEIKNADGETGHAPCAYLELVEVSV